MKDTEDRKSKRLKAAGLVVAEANRACAKHSPFNSTHEGYAVILEELDEMFDAIRANDKDHAVHECVQVGAMALRFVAEFGTL